MRKRILGFVVQFVAVTAVLGLFWQFYLKVRYPRLFGTVALPVLRLFGVTDWPLPLVLGHFATWIPYCALVMSSRWLQADWMRIWRALVVGWVAVIVGHLLLSIGVYHLAELCESQQTFYSLLIPMYLINDTLPVILWLTLLPECVGKLLPKAGGGVHPIGTSRKSGTPPKHGRHQSGVQTGWQSIHHIENPNQ
jgi:hypothetical protein